MATVGYLAIQEVVELSAVSTRLAAMIASATVTTFKGYTVTQIGNNSFLVTVLYI